jgi:hypothetical protein
MSGVSRSLSLDRGPIADAPRTTSDPFERPRCSLSLAKRRIRDLEAEIKAFMDSEPYANVAERNPTTNELEQKIKFTRRVPCEMEAVAIDVIDNLRSALDQAACACAIAAGGTEARRALFPIARDRAQVDQVIERRCQDLPLEIVAVIKGLKPYAGGNDLLVALNALYGVNRYRLLTPMGMITGAAAMGDSARSGSAPARPPRWDRAKNEIVYARARPGKPVQCDLRVSLFVSFGDVPLVARQPPVPLLDSMAAEVEAALATLEAEARRMAPLS